MENLIKYIPTYFLYTLINMTFYLYFRAVFKFDQSNKLGVTATGKEFGDFKTHFEADERGFGYIRIKVSDIFNFAYPAFFDQNLFRVTRLAAFPIGSLHESCDHLLLPTGQGKIIFVSKRDVN